MDKGGLALYLHHCSRRYVKLKEKVVAYLHDVLEDGRYDEMYLRMCGFSDSGFEAVKTLTKVLTKTRQITQIESRKNKLATSVKLADLSHNMDISHYEHPSAEYSRVENGIEAAHEKRTRLAVP